MPVQKNIITERMLKIAGLLQEHRIEIPFTIELSPDISIIYNAFIKHNKKLFLVGGAVRDAIMGIKPKDFDLVTVALPDEVMKILSSEKIKSFPKGESFGVISAIINGEEYEIATFRSESYEGGDGRRPSSIGFADMEQDSKRRDLTVNALYYDIKDKKIIDFHNGIEAIKNKQVKTVGSPMEIFTQDRLRVLRALRFAHRFGSKLDIETIQAIKHFKDLPGVSNERIRDEFLRGLKSAINVKDFLEQYTQLGLLERTFPGITLDKYFVPNVKNPWLIIAKIVSNNSYDKILKSLNEAKYQKFEPDTIIFLVKLKNRFQQFDKFSFDTLLDGKWLISLTNDKLTIEKGGLISKEDVETWASIFNIKKRIIDGFMTFKPSVSASNFPDLKQGVELGNKITQANAELFLKLI